jgi:hypothetical protein
MAMLLACVAVAAAACGSGEGQARTVASVAPQAGVKSEATQPASQGPGDMLAFARCMRENGMPDFPDPSGQKGVGLSAEMVNSPQFKAAAKNCKQFQPAVPTRQPPEIKDGWSDADKLKYSACMRQKGVPNFPDPSENGGFIFEEKSGVDPSSPQFKQAEQACKQYQPQNMPKKGQMQGGQS